MQDLDATILVIDLKTEIHCICIVSSVEKYNSALFCFIVADTFQWNLQQCEYRHWHVGKAACSGRRRCELRHTKRRDKQVTEGTQPQEKGQAEAQTWCLAEKYINLHAASRCLYYCLYHHNYYYNITNIIDYRMLTTGNQWSVTSCILSFVKVWLTRAVLRTDFVTYLFLSSFRSNFIILCFGKWYL